MVKSFWLRVARTRLSTLYGDGLVEFALDGDKTKVLAENSGTINAEGGTVALSASAAKDVVDNVVNMSGIINVSSVTVKGGKIILGGGKAGKVSVSGKMDASGTTGGKIDVKGKDINVADTAEIAANGAGSRVDIIADDHADFRGTILATGGAVEVSGYGTLGFSGLVQADSLLLDPTWALVHSGAVNNPLGLNYVLSAQALADSMASGTTITVLATDFIDVGTRGTAYSTGNAGVDVALNALVGTGAIDLSTYYTSSIVPKATFPFFQVVVTPHTTAGSINFQSNTVNFNKDVKMGDGNLSATANTVNLNSRLLDKNGTALGDGRITSNASVINVKSNKALIQQAISLADAPAGATINIGAGTYNESVVVDKKVNIRGANADKHGTDATRGAETIIKPNSPGMHIVASGSGSTVNGVEITGALHNGIWVDGATNVTLINNLIHDVSMDGILADFANGLVAHSNHIYNVTSTGFDIGSGIQVKNTVLATVGGSSTVQANVIHDTGWDGVRVVKSRNVTVKYNDIDNVGRTGLYFGQTVTSNALSNDVKGAVRWGINVEGGSSIDLTNNNVSGTGYDGIRLTGVGGSLNRVLGNFVDTTGLHYTTVPAAGRTGHGISLESSANVRVTGNVIGTTSLAAPAENIRGDGIYANNIGAAIIKQNHISKTKSMAADNGSGIRLISSNGATIGGTTLGDGNVIFDTAWDGIRVETSNGVTAGYNDIDRVHGTGIYFSGTDGAKILENDVDTTTDRYGIEVNGGSNATVTHNDINNTNRHGIYVHNVTGTNLVNLNHVDTTRNGNKEGNGIHADTVSGLSIIGNILGLESGTDKIKGDGIFGTAVNGVIIKSNEVTNTLSTTYDVGSGIQIQNTIGGTIGGTTAAEGNKLYNTAWDGVRVYKSRNITVQKNDVDDVGRTGLYFGQTITSNAIDNDVKNAARWGVNVEGGSSINVADNHVSRTGFDGIRVIGLGGSLNKVSGNFVDTTGLHYTTKVEAGRTGHGISLESSANVRVTGNVIGTTSMFSAPENIRGDGIYANNIGAAIIKQNTISKTKSMVADSGNGIRLISSNGATIGGLSLADANIIFNTAWDGIRVETANNVTAGYNKIDKVSGTGVYFGDTAGAKILGNVINTTTNGYGIEVNGGSNATVTANDINNTNRHGIYVHSVKGTNLVNLNHVDTTRYGNNEGNGIHADRVSNLSIIGNILGLESGVNKIKGDGIFATYTNGVIIKSNEVTNTQSPVFNIGSGIQVQNTVGATIGGPTDVEGNKLYNTGWDGVRVVDSSDVTAQKNDIENVRRTGVYFGDVANGDILGNFITGTVQRYGINYENGSDATITGNDIDNTNRHGIFIHGVTGTNLVNNNYVDFTNGGGLEGDGIHAVDVNALTVSGNHIGTDGGGIWGNGIFVDPSPYAQIIDNVVAGVGRNGIYSLNNDGAYILRNNVSDSNWNGILVEGGYGVTVGADADESGENGNTVSNSGINGIEVDGTNGTVSIRHNNVTNSGTAGANGTDGDGIQVHDIGATEGNNYVDIFGNVVDTAAEDGIDVHNLDGTVKIEGNSVTTIGFNGGGEGADYNGHDGIYVADVYGSAPIMAGRAAVSPSGPYTVSIIGNDVDTTEDDGIEVINSGRTLIQGNDIFDVGQGATYSDLYGYGADGIHVRNVYNYNYDNGEDTTYDLMRFALEPVSDSAVDILDNRVNVDRDNPNSFIGNTADDGIQVLFSGNTVIDSNRVANSGFVGSSEEPSDDQVFARAEGSIQNQDSYGADGIHVLVGGKRVDSKSALLEVSTSGTSVDVTNNFVDNSADDGIEVEGAQFVTVDTNDVDVSGDIGILVHGYGSGYIEPPVSGDDEPVFQMFAVPNVWTAVVTNNKVNNSIHDGVQIVDYDNIEASYNTISNSGNMPEQTGAGLHIAGAYNGIVNVEGNTLTDNRVGMEFNSGLIDLTGVSNTIAGGEVGMRFSPFVVYEGEGDPIYADLALVDEDGDVNSLPTQAPANYGGTIGQQIFTGQSQYYVELLNGAFADTWVDGRFSSYDGFTPNTSLLSQADFDLLEPKFYDWNKNNGVGRFWGIQDDAADIPQERILNTFDAFGDLGGEVNVVLLGLPPLPGGGTPSPTNIADFLNDLTPNAGDETGNPADIEPAAGGDEPAAGDTTTTAQNNSSCWADATASAVAGSTTTFSFSSVINQTTLAQETNCGSGQPQ